MIEKHFFWITGVRAVNNLFSRHCLLFTNTLPEEEEERQTCRNSILIPDETPHLPLPSILLAKRSIPEKLPAGYCELLRDGVYRDMAGPYSTQLDHCTKLVSPATGRTEQGNQLNVGARGILYG